MMNTEKNLLILTHISYRVAAKIKKNIFETYGNNTDSFLIICYQFDVTQFIGGKKKHIYLTCYSKMDIS